LPTNGDKRKSRLGLKKPIKKDVGMKYLPLIWWQTGSGLIMFDRLLSSPAALSFQG
jgi:hypothetical protein